MPFELVEPEVSADGPLHAELALLARAEAGAPLAQLWQAPASLVVPRSYLRFAAFEAARTDFAARGCPVWLRQSGGGLVPQGPGILNLTLAYRVGGAPGDLAEAVYLHLCDVLRAALDALGVATHWQAVDGSFCDGRFNLAWGPAGAARKIAGTAQYWRRVPAAQAGATPGHVVLAHAVLVVDADLDEIHRRANGFEARLGSGRHYDPAAVVSVRQAIEAGGASAGGALAARVGERLRAALAQRPPPR
ncbi:lipoyl protein ligase domain-containing protein [Cupriavidus malaysiensis]|uniref:BPL/LPL catalytic domain-containing protein n=1 Tax=Cupriavidus malaysiensis TaxID=367825 RepID=A0ABM7D882_9BURK|nr:hypothetical protein [Cupriavidus malaysiensis]AOZ08404.1 hypothetical protein BKK80_20770 [Cupriavidus malaysiensis]